MSRVPSTLSVTALLVGIALAQPSTWTQSAAPALIQPGNSVSCNYLALGRSAHLENHYLRRYRGSQMPAGAHHVISAVRVGVLEASSLNGSQPLEARLHIVPAGALFPAGLINYPQIATAAATVNDTTTGGFVDIPLSPPVVFVANGSDLLVDIVTPANLNQNHLLFLGANDRGETGPSYTFAQGCGLGVPTPLPNIGWPSTHWLIDVVAWTDAPTVGANTSAAPGALRFSNAGLISGHDYLNLASGELCPQGLGTGPWIGLCAADPNVFLPFLALPPETRPLRFSATSTVEFHALLTGLPAGLVLEAVAVDLGTLRFGPATRIVIP